MDIEKLLSGICVVIDDAFGNPEKKHDKIFEICNTIQNRHIPILKYSDLPENEEIRNISGVNFVLLDWQLIDITEEEKIQGVTLGDERIRQNTILNIEFLQDLKEYCFAPVFIFSAHNPDNIKRTLSENGLYSEEKSNYIFVKSKSDLTSADNNDLLFQEIENWIKNTTSIYVLKEWESSLHNAKNQLFWSLYNINPDWPKVMWETYKQDYVNQSNELGELLTNNLKGRMSHFEFEEEILGRTNDGPRVTADIRKVMEGASLIPTDNPSVKDEIHFGDIFLEIVDEKNIYSINIRPQCDCIQRDKKKNSDDILLYLIQGCELEEPTDIEKVKALFDEKFGFTESIGNTIIFPVKGKIVKFQHRNFRIRPFSDLKDHRIGTLIPPYIIRLQQRFLSYIERQGIPKIPKAAIFIETNPE